MEQGYDVDLAVVGSGGAAMAAGIAARQASASVVLLERAALGGTFDRAARRRAGHGHEPRQHVELTTRLRRGIHRVPREIDLAEAIARPWTYERDPRGHLGLLADTDGGVLLGAWAVAPQAGEWIHQASLAIRAGIPIEVLLDQVAQFPTYSEGYLAALEALDL